MMRYPNRRPLVLPLLLQLLLLTNGRLAETALPARLPRCTDLARLEKEDRSRVYQAEDPATKVRISATVGDLLADRLFCMTEFTRQFGNHSAMIEATKHLLLDLSNPSPLQFMNHTYLAFNEFLGHSQRYHEWRYCYERMLASVDFKEFFLPVFGAALAFLLVRAALNALILRPVLSRLGVGQINQQKLLTSVWFVLVYTVLWLLSCYVLFYLRSGEFTRSLLIFADIDVDLGYFRMPVPRDLRLVYIVQCGFYLSSLVSLFKAEDKWREDKLVFALHHVLTIGLLSFSYFAKFYRIGLIVLFLHDLSDIVLEFGKSNVYVKFRNGKYYEVHDHLATACYVVFVLSWVVMRLWLFPLKVLHTTGWGVYISRIGRPAFFFTEFNCMLWALFFMHIYWTYLIGVLAVKLLSGQMRNLNDIRESDVDISVDPKQLQEDNKNK